MAHFSLINFRIWNEINIRILGKVRGDHISQKNFLRDTWFTIYSRGGGKMGSCGFEHVFLNEIKNNEISGLHNWIYFNEQEKAQNLDYKGYTKTLSLGNVSSKSTVTWNISEKLTFYIRRRRKL